ncbi:hypothetical protein [Paraburkholderia elongata]|uniref:Uncharacterized protein n=1 Tax=Paraburkholderia elongata TaxID=2675747 RepID=A0A972NXT1_9BURK|nr:hypothetical protein [Paraburkholderia elongata]NPT60334.1 hypothetical protein [Paraburkholderia elongata]
MNQHPMAQLWVKNPEPHITAFTPAQLKQEALAKAMSALSGKRISGIQATAIEVALNMGVAPQKELLQRILGASRSRSRWAANGNAPSAGARAIRRRSGRRRSGRRATSVATRRRLRSRHIQREHLIERPLPGDQTNVDQIVAGHLQARWRH